MEQNLSLYHIPPQDIESEESVIGSILINGSIIKDILDILTPEDFYRSSNRKIYKCMIDLEAQEKPIDLVTVTSHLRDNAELEAIGGAAYLANLTDTVPYAENAREYALNVHKKACLRNLISICNDVTKRCFEARNEDVIGLMNDAETNIRSISYKDPNRKNYSTMQDLVVQSVDRYEERYNNQDRFSGIASGFHMLDYMLDGFQDTDFILIGARPGMGKTAFAMGLSTEIASDNIPVGVFSLEMSKEQLFNRIISGKTHINLQKFRSGKFTNDEWNRITDAQGRLFDLPIYIDDNFSLHYNDIYARAREWKRKHGIKLLIIDYLQLVKGDRSQNRVNELGSISRACKGIAKDLELPLIALSQLNRSLERRPNPHKRPMLSDLRESGDLEQDTDVVIFIYREEMYLTKEEKENHPEIGKAEFNIAKQRNGPTGMVKLAWKETNATFYNIVDK